MLINFLIIIFFAYFISEFNLAASLESSTIHSTDILIFGASPSGILAAVAAARRNVSVLLFNPYARLGGMMSSGLGFTDVGDAESIGGLALEFFIRNARYYNRTASTPDFLLEPHVAESLFATMIIEQASRLTLVNALDATITDVELQFEEGPVLKNVSFSDGTIVQALAFIDASYEGDLISAANVTFVTGRESSTTYNESLAGVTAGHSFPLDPRVSNSSGSALLPGVTGQHAGELHSGDLKTQAYTFRLCLTSDTNNMIPFSKPENYNSSDFELLRRYASRLSSPKLSDFLNLEQLHNNKFDLNNGGFVSMDMIGGSWNYPLGNASVRKSIWEQHFYYCSGTLFTLANDVLIPQVIRDDVKKLGLCADEFKNTKGWPEMIYVREARRMVGDRIFLQTDIDNRPSYGNNSIGLGSYTWDAHAAQRVPCIVNYTQHPLECVTVVETSDLDFILDNNDVAVHVMQEGDPGARAEANYELPLSILFPKKVDSLNLLSPTCPSASHVAFSSVRTEPTLMHLGHAAGDAAALFVKGGSKAIQDIDENVLHSWLEAEGARTTKF